MLSERLSYDPLTGVLRWLAHPAMPPKWNGRFAGKEAFTAISNGYRVGLVNSVKHYAHRIAWVLHYGEPAPEQIDHTNGNRTDNRICNLRAANNTINGRNQHRLPATSSGQLGVSWDADRQRWMVRIGREHLGRYRSLEEAVAVRKQAEKERGFAETHGTLPAI